MILNFGTMHTLLMLEIYIMWLLILIPFLASLANIFTTMYYPNFNR
jgi:hypothetical protein